jgi:hypothetical protein
MVVVVSYVASPTRTTSSTDCPAAIPPLRSRYRRNARGWSDITQAILDGHQPRDLTPEKLLEHSRLPLAWHYQRTALGFA